MYDFRKSNVNDSVGNLWCVRANKHLEVEFEKAHDAKPSKPKGNRIRELVDDIRIRLKTYDGNDKRSLKSIETALDEILRIENGR